MASIKKKPTGKVSSLSAPSRNGGGYKWTGTWKLSSWLTSTDNEARATGVQVRWVLGMGRGNKNVQKFWEGGTGYLRSTFGLNNGWNLGKWDDFKNWYPYTSQKLHNIHLFVRVSNRKGYGPWTHVYRPVEVPPKPTVPALAQNEQTGEVSTTIKQDRRDGYNNPCQYTEYEIKVRDSRVNNGEWRLISQSFSRSSEFTISYDVTQRQELGYADWVEVQMRARACGFNGKTDWVTRKLMVSYPNQALIKNASGSREAGDKVTVAISGLSPTYTTGCRLQTLVNTEYLTADDIPADANWTDTQSVDNARATALSVSVQDVIPAAGRTTWVRVKTWNQFEKMFYRFSEPFRLTVLEAPAPTGEDDAIKLLSLVSDENGDNAIAVFGWNEDGTDDADYTEVTWSDNENAWRSTAKPSSYEFEWSDGALAWTDPSTGTVTNFNDSATIYIDNVKEGTTYYVRARRVKEVNGVLTYSNYTDTLTVTPSFIPPTVELTVPAFVARGSSLAVSWAFSSEATQTSWQLIKGTLSETVDTSGDEPVITQTFTEEEVVASGDDAIGATVVSADRLAGLTDGYGSVSLAVRVATGGHFVMSEGRTVTIADPPTLVSSASAIEVAEQGFTIPVASSVASNVSAVITADGATGDTPTGQVTQVLGDTIYAATVAPEWEDTPSYSATGTVSGEDRLDAAITFSPNIEPLDYRGHIMYDVTADGVHFSGNETAKTAVLNGHEYELTASVFAATITVEGAERMVGCYATVFVQRDGVDIPLDGTLELTVRRDSSHLASLAIPDGLDLWDGANYHIRMKAIDTMTGLESEVVELPLSVAWSHQAPAPSDAITVTPSDVTDDDGFRERKVEIQLAAPAGAAEGDRYEVYRATPDGIYLIALEQEQDALVTDLYAPYGSAEYAGQLVYRVAVRTADGDVNWLDFPYELDGNDLRIDFGSQYVELPWNLTIGDAFTKDFEARSHLGSSTAQGYWNENVSRQASFSTDVLRIEERSQMETLRALARYDGPAFVRTPSGCAYQANINVSGLDETYGSGFIAVALDGEEVALTAPFLALEPERSEGADPEDDGSGA